MENFRCRWEEKSFFLLRKDEKLQINYLLSEEAVKCKKHLRENLHNSSIEFQKFIGNFVDDEFVRQIQRKKKKKS